ncbi:HD domain-containing protein [Archaeoglobus sulfaticallidus]|uniref:HD domain-containing protein n=1 Tax=Archaeoglobus sulfaticallidus TaxID=1316941 RepID=UPI00191C0DC7|nr:HD domain-containing protein [Archaeoglobus sulfaticallidus]
MNSHDHEHVKRVLNLALYIAEREGGDIAIVKKAAELHDIARDKENHAVEGAKIAREILKEEGFDREFIDRVAHCIEAHSFSSGIEPKTLEAKILSDADKLDAMGAIGVVRAFQYSFENGRSLEDTLKHFDEKLLKLYDCLYTNTAKKIGMERHRFMKEFYERIKKELKGCRL